MKKSINFKIILLYLVLFIFYNFILFYKKINSIDLLLSNIFFNIIYFLFFFFLFKKNINNIINKKFFIYYIINVLWFILIFLFNKKSFEINNYQYLNIHNFYWIILYLIDRIYFVVILLTILFFTNYLIKKFINLKIKKIILRQKNKLQIYLLSFLNFIFSLKINFKTSINIFLNSWNKFNEIILIINIKKTMRLIEFKRGHFPHLFLKINKY